MTSRPSALLVEDHEVFAENVVAALSERGLQVDWAKEWEEALELFRVNGYELVIADYNLPKTQLGLQLLARMKTLLPASKLVLISGALTPGAERALDDVDLIDAYYSKGDANLIARLAEHVEASEQDANNPTDWRAFASGYVSDLDRDFPEIARIDELLRADVERGGV
jgi:CheY-like chemotaxis protein